MEYLEGGELY